LNVAAVVTPLASRLTTAATRIPSLLSKSALPIGHFSFASFRAFRGQTVFHIRENSRDSRALSELNLQWVIFSFGALLIHISLP